MAAPLQAPPVAKSCKDFEAPNRTAIKLAGVKYNDSCIVAVIHGCDLQVDLVVNAEVRANLKSFTWDRRVNRTGMSKPYSKTANTTAYGYKRRTVNIWQSQLYPDIPGCSKKKMLYDWSATATVTLRTVRGTIHKSATHKALNFP
jgi:hypothetical protein